MTARDEFGVPLLPPHMEKELAEVPATAVALFAEVCREDPSQLQPGPAGSFLAAMYHMATGYRVDFPQSVVTGFLADVRAALGMSDTAPAKRPTTRRPVRRRRR